LRITTSIRFESYL